MDENNINKTQAVIKCHFPNCNYKSIAFFGKNRYCISHFLLIREEWIKKIRKGIKNKKLEQK